MGVGRLRGMTIVGATLIVVIAATVASRSGGGDERVDAVDPRRVRDVKVDPTPDPVAPPRTASLAAPTDGTASRLLPVIAEPSTDLAEGQVVAISGSGFTPGATLGAVMCSAGAAGGGGVAFCELAHYDNFSASSEGQFSDDYVLRRYITTPSEGQVDCAESTDRCLLAVGNISDYDESGGSFISFAGAPDPPPPSLVVTPSDGLVDGQVVSVEGTGIRAAPDGWLRQCPAGRLEPSSCRLLVQSPNGAAFGGRMSVTVSLARVLEVDGHVIDCAAPPGCVIATTEYAGRLATVPLRFAPDPAPPTTQPTPTSTTVPPLTTTSTTSSSTSTSTSSTTAPSTSTSTTSRGSG